MWHVGNRNENMTREHLFVFCIIIKVGIPNVNEEWAFCLNFLFIIFFFFFFVIQNGWELCTADDTYWFWNVNGIYHKAIMFAFASMLYIRCYIIFSILIYFNFIFHISFVCSFCEFPSSNLLLWIHLGCVISRHHT